MYFPSLKLFEVLKFFQFLMLFENQFLDTSSNFRAPENFSPTFFLIARYMHKFNKFNNIKKTITNKSPALIYVNTSDEGGKIEY